jgi:hypothetical protein
MRFGEYSSARKIFAFFFCIRNNHSPVGEWLLS